MGVQSEEDLRVLECMADVIELMGLSGCDLPLKVGLLCSWQHDNAFDI